ASPSSRISCRGSGIGHGFGYGKQPFDIGDSIVELVLLRERKILGDRCNRRRNCGRRHHVIAEDRGERAQYFLFSESPIALLISSDVARDAFER
ncbi:MAG: hypothetical protein V4760_04615, partial [Bdellovibrionota bacterium]